MEKKFYQLQQLNIEVKTYLEWSKQISQLVMKLSDVIRVLNKLRHKANGNILKMVYHSLSTFH